MTKQAFAGIHVVEFTGFAAGPVVGKPVIKGTRLTVQYILGLLSQGVTLEEVLEEYHGLTREDVLACLLFATETLENTSFMPLYEGAV